MLLSFRNLVLSSAALCTTAAFAAEQKKVEVPFSFVAKNHAYQAGSYTVTVDWTKSLVTLKEIGKPSQPLMWIMLPGATDPNHPNVRLTFDVTDRTMCCERSSMRRSSRRTWMQSQSRLWRAPLPLASRFDTERSRSMGPFGNSPEGALCFWSQSRDAHSKGKRGRRGRARSGWIRRQGGFFLDHQAITSDELRRILYLERENARLQRLVAELLTKNEQLRQMCLPEDVEIEISAARSDHDR